MSESGHDLHAEFPADEVALHQLKIENEHFRGLAKQHHDLTHRIARITAGIETATDILVETLKKQRLVLLDEIAGMIAARKAA